MTIKNQRDGAMGTILEAGGLMVMPIACFKTGLCKFTRPETKPGPGEPVRDKILVGGEAEKLPQGSDCCPSKEPQLIT